MTSLLCQQCSGSVYVEGYPAGVPYVCPYCRGAMPPRTPSPVEADLRDQLAAVTAERDEERRLRLLAADHAAEVQAGYERDLAALRRAAWVLLSALTVAGPDHGFGVEVGRLALRQLVGEPSLEPDPGPAPGTVAWFDRARADLAAEGTPVDAADWLIGPDED